MAHEELSPQYYSGAVVQHGLYEVRVFPYWNEGGSTSSYAGIGTLAAGEWVQITTDTPDIQTGGARGLVWVVLLLLIQ